MRSPSRALTALILAAFTALGLVVRLRMADQSLFADEISTYWVVSKHSFTGVVSTLHTDEEISPPLYFLAGWITTRIDMTAELLRAPSLLAGAATIPLTYLLGLRTVGRRAGFLAALLVTLSPFLIFYSSEARGYAVAILLVLGSTLAMLAAIDSRRTRWWVVYGACSCAAVYTHYTAVFALGAQLLWLLAAHPAARKPAVIANVAAAVAYLPWLSGLIADFNSPTTSILNQLDVVNLHTIRVSLEHWAAGYPLALRTTKLGALPGHLALALLVLGVVVSVAALVPKRSRDRAREALGGLDRPLLVVVLAAGVPLGLGIASALGTNVVSVRHLATAWPAFAVLLAAILTAPPQPFRALAAALVVAGFGIGAAKLLESRFQRPDYDAAADYIDDRAVRGDVVIDGTNLSPAPITALDAALDRPQRLFYPFRPRVQFDPFRILAPPPRTSRVIGRAAKAAGRHRIFVVATENVIAEGGPLQNPQTKEILAAIPHRYRLVERHEYPGILEQALLIYAPRG